MIKKIKAEFFKTAIGNEPVRDALLKLGRPVKTVVGTDVRFVEWNWRVDRPYVDLLRSGTGTAEASIFEVRHRVDKAEYRTLFFVFEDRMILVHFFRKKAQKTPLKEINLAWSRMKDWIREVKGGKKP